MRIWIAAAMVAQAAYAHADPDHCKLAVDFGKRGDLARAGLHYEACADRDSEDLRAVARKLDHSELARISVSTEPGVVVEISALPGERFEGVVWVPAGTYELRGTAPDGVQGVTTVEAKAYSRGTVILQLPRAKAPPPPRTVSVDIGAGGGEIGEQQDGPPPDIKHPTLLPKKYKDGGAVGGDPIDDPFALHEPTISDGAGRGMRVGLRVGAGVASASDTLTAFGLGLAGSYEVRPGLRATARLDWSRRSSSDMGKLDVLGASGGMAVRVATTPVVAFDAGAALRPELRLGDTFMGRDVNRVGLAGDVGVDAVLRHLPFVVGVRGEQGLTQVASGIRERALLLELAVELR